MYKRICIIILDGVGIGELPDAANYGDEGAHTLGNIFTKRGKLDLPNLYAMGLGHITNAKLPKIGNPTAAYGRMATKTLAKDTTSGHWELAGIVMDPPFATFTSFPEALLDDWLKQAKSEGLLPKNLPGVVSGQIACSSTSSTFSETLRWLGNRPASGTQIIQELGEAHIQTGAPIVYTSADSVFQVAAHEEIIPVEKLYRLCQLAREMLVGDNIVGRVIARPFIGTPGNFTRTKNRKDYSMPPVCETILDSLEKKGYTTLGIGKIEDIFCGHGIAHSIYTSSNESGIEATIKALETDDKHTIIFTNLVDFDMHYGHRNDVEGFAVTLESFDAHLPRLTAALKPSDLLIITSDHGCDPTTPSTDHSREYVPILVHGAGVQPISLGTRCSLTDVAATISEILIHKPWAIGESFLQQCLDVA